MNLGEEKIKQIKAKGSKSKSQKTIVQKKQTGAARSTLYSIMSGKRKPIQRIRRRTRRRERKKSREQTEKKKNKKIEERKCRTRVQLQKTKETKVGEKQIQTRKRRKRRKKKQGQVTFPISEREQNSFLDQK